MSFECLLKHLTLYDMTDYKLKLFDYLNNFLFTCYIFNIQHYLKKKKPDIDSRLALLRQ